MKQPTPLVSTTKIIVILLLWLPFYGAVGQDLSKDPQQYIPQRFIDKIELVVGPGISLVNGTDRAAGNNPDIRTGYSNKVGYSAGIGLIHSMNKFELKARFLWDQRGFVSEIWDDGTLFNYKYDLKLNYLTVAILSSVYIEKSRRLQLYFGFSGSHLQSLEALDYDYQNGVLIYSSRFTSNPAVANYSLGTTGGIGWRIYKTKRFELASMLQADFMLNDIINENGTIIRTNNISINISLKFINTLKKPLLPL